VFAGSRQTSMCRSLRGRPGVLRPPRLCKRAHAADEAPRRDGGNGEAAQSHAKRHRLPRRGGPSAPPHVRGDDVDSSGTTTVPSTCRLAGQRRWWRSRGRARWQGVRFHWDSPESPCGAVSQCRRQALKGTQCI
jgi:hypothetical protein